MKRGLKRVMKGESFYTHWISQLCQSKLSQFMDVTSPRSDEALQKSPPALQ